jgi:hypothetical protein
MYTAHMYSLTHIAYYVSNVDDTHDNNVYNFRIVGDNERYMDKKNLAHMQFHFFFINQNQIVLCGTFYRQFSFTWRIIYNSFSPFVRFCDFVNSL